MPHCYVMEVPMTGEVALPREVLARWQTDRVVVVDLGDRLVLRPMPADPLEPLAGKYVQRGGSTDDARRASRADDAAIEQHKRI